MSSIARLSAEDFANYCTGDSCSDGSLENQLRELEVQECIEYDSDGTFTVSVMKIVMVI